MAMDEIKQGVIKINKKHENHYLHVAHTKL